LKKAALEFSRIIATLRGEPVTWPPDTDWQQVAQAARLHGVLVLLSRRLPRPELEASARPLIERALVLTRQLRTLLDRLQGAGLTVLPIKGPVLAATMYGDVTLRGASGDLDLVIQSVDFPHAVELLSGDGYRRVEPALDEHDHEQWESEAHLLPPSTGTLVELHTELIGNFHTAPVDLQAVLERSSARLLFGTTVRVPAAEDLLLYLCLHGARHMWSRLLWICDLDALLRATPSFDWEALFARADAISARRRVTLGLFLAHRLLGTPIADAAVLFREGRLFLLERLARHRMSETTAGRPVPGLVGRLLSELAARETARQQSTYLRRQFAPNARDRSWIKLPRRLRWLLWILRPLRVLTRFGRVDKPQ
jgi:hypothetical protein